MSKSLTQITFDFDAVPEPEVKPAALPVPEPVPAPTPEPEVIRDIDLVPAPAVAMVEEQQEPLQAPAILNSRGRRSLKDISARVDLVEVPDDEVLFQKQYYSIGEVAQMFRENQSLIRYWETEFDILKPRKNRKGDRFFRPVDVKNLVLIYDLLRRRKFTIEGAKDFLRNNKKVDEKFAMIQSLEKIKGFLLELKAYL